MRRVVCPMRVIGVSGKKQHGKDTIGDLLATEHGFIKVAFADKLREVALAVNPIVDYALARVDQEEDPRIFPTRLKDVVDIEGWEVAKANYPEVRRFLQVLGTEGGRRILGEDVWVDALLPTLESSKMYVVTDCRFPNEAKAIKKLGGEIWRVQRTSLPPSFDTHESEVALDDWPWDELILNESSLVSLGQKVGRTVVKKDACCPAGIEYAVQTGGHPCDHPEECEEA